MGILTHNSEAIKVEAFDGFIDNLIGEGTPEVVARGTFKETFVDIVDPFILMATGIRITTPMRAAHMRFYRIGARFQANSITGLPILFDEDYEIINLFESGYVTPNPDYAAARTLLTIEDRIAQLKSRIPGIKVTLIDGGKEVTNELLNALHEYARIKALDAYGKPIQLSFRYA